LYLKVTGYNPSSLCAARNNAGLAYKNAKNFEKAEEHYIVALQEELKGQGGELARN